MEKEKLLSVGIDLGTSTSQIIISELTVENFASDFTIPRIDISEKEIVYRSEIIFTPLLDESNIDAEKLKEFVEREYERAGIQKGAIHTGAVIITGETARKENASNVLNALSNFAGDFVVATAGPDLESIIAGKGAGTQFISKESGERAVNLDIGGGTSNLVVFSAGDLESTGCFDIGGRVIKLDVATQTVKHMTPKVVKLAEHFHIPLAIGKPYQVSDLEKVCQHFAQILENAIGIGEQHELYDLFVTNHGIDVSHNIPLVTFSGGVADCFEEFTEQESLRFGDIGLLLGRAIKRSRIFSEKEVKHSKETIQATVVGAGTHLTEVSGSTISFTENILPIANLPVVHLEKVKEEVAENVLPKQILQKIKWHFENDSPQKIALAFDGWRNPRFQEIQDLTKQIVEGLTPFIQANLPIILVVKEDMAKTIGQSLYHLLPKDYPFISIDSITADNGDYIDIGEAIAGGSVLPVIIKTLVFD
ncbi:ethanolamine utilization protein EutA [Pilibacter termitis]|uniref:Chaperone protein DnaK n=1 Tax=Pilibacter termitis TaxID=263852 RepID=A0A1T4K6G6_9ENTE|nr:ethanolamine ammonia-lyase reactivating factor EutA [Pilibacter termitis]SJZ38011.1 ethanolamine utilization protein EutA [Pilibacter termitis]